MAKGSYLGGGTIVRADVYGPDRKRTAVPKSRRPPKDVEWLAANKRSKRKKQVDKSSTMEAEYKAVTKRRRRRAKVK